MGFLNLLTPDLLPLLLTHLTRQDAAVLATVCKQAAETYKALFTTVNASNMYTPAARVIVCASGTRQLLLLPLTPHGQAYVKTVTHTNAVRRSARSQASCSSSGQRRHLQAVNLCNDGTSTRNLPWFTGICVSPYDHSLYVASYATATEPAAVIQFSPSRLRRRGCLVSGPVIENPEGLAIARQACFVASAGNAAVIAVVLQGSSRGTILQQLALAEDAVPWGMAVWDPSTYPLHALAAREAYTPRHTTKEHGYKPSSDVQPQHAQAAVASAPNGAESNAVPTDQGAPHQPSNATAISGHAAATCDGGIAGGSCSVDGAEGCLLVAIQADAEKKSWWLPPAGPPSGSLVCIPLGEGAQMLGWREWSKVKIKRPSGVTIDHAGYVWTTSLERLLLRFAGPCHSQSGSLLQQLDLQQLLPRFARQLYPMDVQAVVQMSPHQLSSSLLIVTVHAGPRSRGAAVVLRLENGSAPAAVRLVDWWGGEGPRLRMEQPNMVCIQ